MKRLSLYILLLASLSAMAIDYNYYPQSIVNPGEYLYVPADSTARGILIELRARISYNNDAYGISPQSWRVAWSDPVSADEVAVNIGWGNTDFGSDFDRRFMTVNLLVNDSVVAQSTLYDKVDLYNGFNALSIDVTDGAVVVDAGNRYLYPVLNYKGHFFPPAAFSVTASSPLDVAYCRTEIDGAEAVPPLTEWNLNAVVQRLADSTDPREGVWRYLDRVTDTELSRLGGRYTIATIRDGDIYRLIYLDGAETFSDLWRPGMEKGWISPTIFVDNFNLNWRQASGELLPVDHDLSASITDGAILTLNFPLINTTVRFSRVPLKQLSVSNL